MQKLIINGSTVETATASDFANIYAKKFGYEGLNTLQLNDTLHFPATNTMIKQSFTNGEGKEFQYIAIPCVKHNVELNTDEVYLLSVASLFKQGYDKVNPIKGTDQSKFVNPALTAIGLKNIVTFLNGKSLTVKNNDTVYIPKSFVTLPGAEKQSPETNENGEILTVGKNFPRFEVGAANLAIVKETLVMSEVK